MPQSILQFKPVEMNREAMEGLERLGLIERLAPGRHQAGRVTEDNVGKSLYESQPRFGGHKLIVATIASPTLRYFGSHQDNEDVWLIGKDTYRPLYFFFATCLADEFAKRVAAGRLATEDLCCLRVRYNDPEASFFVVKKQVPHGECVLPGPGEPPSFYVSEATDLKIDPLGFADYRLEIDLPDGPVRVSP
ncbi:MAG: hypothetical protein LBU79_00800 [Planctomycetota bacterium]|jgi:hypothetical protein|nr:hypothetical protein [Planctomycetota bacterium]